MTDEFLFVGHNRSRLLDKKMTDDFLFVGHNRSRLLDKKMTDDFLFGCKVTENF